MEFRIETYEENLLRLTRELQKNQLRELLFSSMMLFARRGSVIFGFLSAVLDAHNEHKPGDSFQVVHDENYTKGMTVLPDGHYTFRHSIWDPKLWHHKIEPRKIERLTTSRFAPILIDLPPRFFKIKAACGPLRKLLSLHLLQPFSASHIKAGVTRRKNGKISSIISTGELSSSLSQNNLTLTIDNNEKSYHFIKKVLDPRTKLDGRGWDSIDIAPKISIVTDYGNYGRPLQPPKIHELAENAIDPAGSVSPTKVLFISQYVPIGRMLRSLNNAVRPKCDGGHGARVTVTLEPKKDYRRAEIGFRMLFWQFKRHVHHDIKTPELSKPSHIKCLIIKYSNGTMSMMFGSDNFDSTADHFYRNTELSLFIDHVRPKDDGWKIINETLNKLVAIKEITPAERAEFE
ncbi:MAG: hypothetical protein LBK50_01325 [Candidatus Nomurabacteria bacterium]|jgi:hypothetical protein|nr:hypothetical protein [Candidatus Nomurabacteria bacterium]